MSFNNAHCLSSLLQSALDMRYKTVGDAMTPLESVFMLDVTGRIDGATMKKVWLGE